jgi:hypothetical protein
MLGIDGIDGKQWQCIFMTVSGYMDRDADDKANPLVRFGNLLPHPANATFTFARVRYTSPDDVFLSSRCDGNQPSWLQWSATGTPTQLFVRDEQTTKKTKLFPAVLSTSRARLVDVRPESCCCGREDDGSTTS